MIIPESWIIVTENQHSKHSAYDHWEQIKSKHMYFRNILYKYSIPMESHRMNLKELMKQHAITYLMICNHKYH